VIKKNEIGRACGTCGNRRGAYRVLVKIPEADSHLEDTGVERIILKYIFKK
jgi:hypothetical protein